MKQMIKKKYWNEDAIPALKEKMSKTNGNAKIRISNKEINKWINTKFSSLIKKDDRGNVFLETNSKMYFKKENLLSSLETLKYYYENDVGFFRTKLKICNLIKTIEELNTMPSVIIEDLDVTLYKWGQASESIAVKSDLFLELRKVLLPYANNFNLVVEMLKDKIIINFELETVNPLLYSRYFDGKENNKKQQKGRVGHTLYALSLKTKFKQTCPLSGSEILYASHLKPWVKCKDEEGNMTPDATNTDNGIPLNPYLDKLVNEGLITFDDEGEIIQSDLLSYADSQLLKLNLSVSKKIPQKYLTDERRKFIKYHRENVFN